MVDLGLERDFGTMLAFAESLIQSLGTRAGDSPIAEVEFIRTRDSETVKAAFRSPAHVLHITAHGDNGPDSLGFWSDDERTTFYLSDLAETFSDEGDGIEAPVILADCCASAQGRFVRAIRDCIEAPAVYIGARKSVDWRESTTFASAFYAAYFRNRGRGLTPTERGMRAAERAIKGYQEIVDAPCPFTASILAPSRKAVRSFGRSH
ncbi:hypothetical protein [Desertimonas flava]|uniref:hypothetical protein n=1 Tax=Desertimonas flava TaxID=2064846 RepID=UPI000E357825|nr:hypothetical protein [Desertimonas flava]